jgi:hypothetical protein
MEISARYDFTLVRKHDRVVGHAVDLDGQGVAHVIERIPNGPVNLRHAAKAVRILDARASEVRDAYLAAGHQG